MTLEHFDQVAYQNCYHLLLKDVALLFITLLKHLLDYSIRINYYFTINSFTKVNLIRVISLNYYNDLGFVFVNFVIVHTFDGCFIVFTG